MRLIEETIPVPLITLENSTHPDTHFTPFEGDSPSEVLAIIKQIYLSFRRRGMSSEQAREKLTKLEPFQYFKELIMSLNDNEMIEEEL